MAERYILRITAGPGYDTSTHVEVPVNVAEPVKISSALADIELNVRIQDYKGLPRGSPSTSTYFSTPPHDYNKDQYSIAFRFTPHKPAPPDENGKELAVDGIPGSDLQFGNDFDRPIRDKLPPGFNTAMNIVKWWIDPGLDGDAYADRPYLFGPALSSFNCIHVGKGEYDESKGGLWFDEGGDGPGQDERTALGVPESSKARMKWGLGDEAKRRWTFRYGQTYALDFYNPYLDFANLSLHLPGFQLPIAAYWDGQSLRYVLRHRTTGEVYLVVLFSLFLKEDINDDGTLKENAGQRRSDNRSLETVEHEEYDEEKALKQAREQLGPAHGEIVETSADDVD